MEGPRGKLLEESVLCPFQFSFKGLLRERWRARVAARGLGLLLSVLSAAEQPAMERTKTPCLGVALLLFLLLVSAAHGVQLVDAKDTAAAAGDGERITVRTSGHGHGHGYSSHSGGHPNGQGGAGVVDPRNLNGRSHPHGGAAGRASGYSSWATCTLVGAVAMLVLL